MNEINDDKLTTNVYSKQDCLNIELKLKKSVPNLHQGTKKIFHKRNPQVSHH